MNSRTVAILDCTTTVYNGLSEKTQALGGIERTVVGLSGALAKQGWDVHVYNHTPEALKHDGVYWHPLKDKPIKADAVIACNDPALFDQYKEKSRNSEFLPVLWMHNRVPLKKVMRKGRLWPLLKWRPVGIFLSDFHERDTSRLLPFRARKIIGHGLEENFFSPLTENNQPASQQAFFISQSYRGLNKVIRLWIERVSPKLPKASLHVFCDRPSEEDLDGRDFKTLSAHGIVIEGRQTRETLLSRLKAGRMVLIPGHKDETFCLSAAEATMLGLPVVTLGTGALRERVLHGHTGYMAENAEDFASAILKLMTDDVVWAKMHKECRDHHGYVSWDVVARQWLALLEGSADEY